MKNFESELRKLRTKINKIDTEIAKLIVSRLEFSKKIGELKKIAGIKIHDLDREKEILEKITKKITNSDAFKEIKRVFKEIFKISRKIQKE